MALAASPKTLDVSPSGPEHAPGGHKPHKPHAAKAPHPPRNPWEQERLAPRYPRLEGEAEADVVVVGAGLSGLATAYRLLMAGKSVVVLEARMVGGGNAGRSTGEVSTWHPATFRELERTGGLERARSVATSHAAAVAFVRRLVKEEGIECGLQEVEGALVVDPGEAALRPESTAARKAARALREELAACCRAGVEGARIGRQKGCAGHQEGGGGGKAEAEALLLPGCLSLNPTQLLQGLAEAVVRRGGQLFESTRAQGGTVTGPSGGVVKTMHGAVARAREAVVLATHSPINRDQLWVHDRQLPKRFYCVGIEVPAAAGVPPYAAQLASMPGPGSGLPQPVFARLAPLGPHHLAGGSEVTPGAGSAYEANKQLLVVRGALHHAGHDEKQYGEPYQDLERWARARFPQCGRTLYAWSGLDYYPADLMGLYGRDPLDLSNPPIYILTGHAGHEWTGSVAGSEAVAGAIAGAPPPWAEAYRPSRVLTGAVVKYAWELTWYFSTVALALLKHVVPRSLADVEGLVAPGRVEAGVKPGEGRVAQLGLRKAALYRDPGGTLHRHSALCTHLGCCVEWNPLDKTFDCPCHGSQYDACGRCIHAPAVADLEDLGSRP
ncbi:hypothetical protein HYH03_016706 [Edaphochlamys debaryana]|uniref:Rieske domain-containing protein n=1 Tax=Edaphochlamys debaryana TaxID=47281 RepID=A0A835XH01_9CHLO|nr:hypothetical protein HYH03_016706 [Edaphochlamys debaryana]|eukprot:KAG2484472.1 hypothetical protein HYH03_016706 [Edaphochlamys debaryana]